MQPTRISKEKILPKEGKKRARRIRARLTDTELSLITLAFILEAPYSGSLDICS
jgi:hypothetical protein